MSQNVEDLGQFVKSLEESIKKNHDEGFAKLEKITVELAIVQTKEAGGRFRILVAEAGGKYQKEEISKITFEFKPRESVGGTIIVHPD